MYIERMIDMEVNKGEGGKGCFAAKTKTGTLSVDILGWLLELKV